MYSVGLVLLCITATLAYSGTPLDDYVHIVDPQFSWTPVGSQRNEAGKYTLYSVLMVSQVYQDASYSNRSIWQHNVGICVPDTVIYPNLAFLALGNGDNSLKLPTDVLPFVAGACQSGIFSVGVGQIPNQPITFNNHGTPVSASEDDAIAYTFRAFMNDSSANPFQILLFAMAKAAVRAMDVTQQFAATLPTPVNIQKFVITGASKRGWTTWLTAAADERVQAIIPIVIPLLNMQNNVINTYPGIGNWGFAFDPYTKQNFFDFKGFPEFDILMKNVDPLAYNARYTNMKKLIIDATLDQFFLLDGPRYFWNQLSGPKYLTLLPNGDHSLSTVTAQLGGILIAFLHAVAQNVALPSYNWQLQYSNSSSVAPSITVSTTSGLSVVEAKVWTANTKPGFRDFRATTCTNLTNPACFSGIFYTPQNLPLPTPRTPSFDIQYSLPNPVIAPSKSSQVFTGFFIQVTFQLVIFGAVPVNLTLTSEANIFPDFFPFDAYVPNYAAVGKDIQCLKSVSLHQTNTGSWVSNGVTTSQWLVSISATKPLYALNVYFDLNAGQQLGNYWGINQRGYIYEVDDWRLNSGLQVPAGQTLTFGYQITGSSAAAISFPGVSCVPPPRNCSVTVSQQFVTQWVSGSYTYRQYYFDIKNYGVNPTSSVNIKLDFSAGSTPSSQWNLNPTASTPTSVTYSAPVWGLPSGASSVSSGYILKSTTSSPFTTPVVTKISEVCV